MHVFSRYTVNTNVNVNDLKDVSHLGIPVYIRLVSSNVDHPFVVFNSRKLFQLIY